MGIAHRELDEVRTAGTHLVGGGDEVEPIDPETSLSYEIGAKTTLLERRLEFNITGFFNNILCNT